MYVFFMRYSNLLPSGQRLIRLLSVFCYGDYSFLITILAAFSLLTLVKIVLVLFEPIYDVFNFSTYQVNVISSIFMGFTMAFIFFAFWNCSRKAYGVFRVAIRLFILQYSFVLFASFLTVIGFVDISSKETQSLPNPNVPIKRKY